MTYKQAACMIWREAILWHPSKCRQKLEHRDEKKPENDGPTLLRRVQSALEGRLKPIAHWITSEDNARLVRAAGKKQRPRKPCGHKAACNCYRPKKKKGEE